MKTCKHRVEVTFVRGPMHLIQAKVSWLPDINIFSDQRDRLLYAYVREDLVYYYDLDLSARLTAAYDKVQGVFRINPLEVTGSAPKKS